MKIPCTITTPTGKISGFIISAVVQTEAGVITDFTDLSTAAEMGRKGGSKPKGETSRANLEKARQALAERRKERK